MSASGSSESPELKTRNSSENSRCSESKYTLYLFSNNKHAASPDNALTDKENTSSAKIDSKASQNEEPSVCLSLLEGNLSAEQETVVRCYLLKTLSARQDLSFENDGKYAELQFSEELGKTFGCYYHRLSKHSITETDPNEENDPEGLKNKDDVQLKLKSWYIYCIEYVQRCIENFGEDLVTLLLCSLWGNVDVISEDEQTKWDTERFLETCCVMPVPTENAKETAIDDASLSFIVTVKDGKIKVNEPLDNFPYCSKWLDKLKSWSPNTVQDLNTLKRLLQKAQTDHYSLYRAYQFLQVSGYEDILLHHVKKEASMAGEKEVLEIISCLQEFLKSKHSTTDSKTK
ncbi:Protein Njmu-R1 like protein [Argiope bruennichi]|uniref:Protein Njmu-R1 like protein n=1 Tax=Argiope bruennichi TaxID=94029 RepID=A0A8T0FTM9_ARGBR|nr:Protein Njmu-R1 like protein [Argiope bruennichi]